jgi:hypothetical protein
MNYIYNEINNNFCLTEDICEKVMKECGIENAMCVFRGMDYFISILRIKKDGFDLEIKNPKKPVRTNDVIQLVLFINGKKYFVTLLVDCIVIKDKRCVIETKIVNKICMEVEDKFSKIRRALQFMYYNTMVSLNLIDETLQEFYIIPQSKININEKKYNVYIKELSKNMMEVLTTKDFINEKNKNYEMTVLFNNPGERIQLKGIIIDKKEQKSGGSKFVLVLLSIDENIRLNKRFEEYLDRKYELKSTLTIW